MKVRWAGRKAKKWRTKNEYKILVERFKSKRPVGMSRRIREMYGNGSCVNILDDFGLELYGSGRDRSFVLVDQVKREA